jgi:hypothetical protein
MQTPSTQGTTPAGEPGGRPCPACGASNGALAAFCWQCYRPFGAPTPSSTLPAAPGFGLRGPALAGPVVVAPPARTRTRATAFAAISVAIVAAVVAWFLFRPGGAELPDAFGTLERIHQQGLDEALSAFSSQLDRMGMEGEIGLYGDGMPSAALAWVSGGPNVSLASGFDGFAAGFDAGFQNGSLDTGRLLDRTIEGTRYFCAPITGPTPAAMCAWQVGDTYWMLYDLSGRDIAAVQALAVSANAAL